MKVPMLRASIEEACGTYFVLSPAQADDLDAVNSDPDAEGRDPEDDTIGFPGDEMADWPLEGDEDEDEE